MSQSFSLLSSYLKKMFVEPVNWISKFSGTTYKSKNLYIFNKQICIVVIYLLIRAKNFPT